MSSDVSVPAQLEIGVLGAGPWGRNLIRAFGSAERCRVAAICDVDGAALEASRALSRDARLAADPSAIFEDRALTACVVATPSRDHAALAVAALEAGKHVFVEKPMALCTADAARIRDAATRTGRRVMVGHLLKYHPAVVELKRRIDRGELGTPRYLVSQRLGPQSARRAEGAWWSLAPHDVSLACFLFGEAPARISARRHALPGAPGDELVVARLDFPGGATAMIVVGACDPSKVRRLTVVGTGRAALFDDTAPTDKLKLYRAPDASLEHLAAEPEAWLGDAIDVPDVPRDEPLLCEARHFVGGVLDRAPVHSDADDGATVVRWLELGDRSMRDDGRPVAP